MSDWLVHLQDRIAGYPSWLVIGGGVIVVALVFMLLGKVLRMLGVLMFVALAFGGAWYGWQRLTHDPAAEPRPAAPAHRLYSEPTPAPAPPTHSQPVQPGHAPAP
ncbi:hypothetical protein ASA1KI_03930 [Opitutales bacterium ASA1]|uniref:hypothetical protein n=1 Tax=Congregicoccus parvus TaxID=3081749 RepID=UPI002B30154B|nr:hypothetical protein ASA1KI_03930 [Opitutales bacterium ASA1]